MGTTQKSSSTSAGCLVPSAPRASRNPDRGRRGCRSRPRGSPRRYDDGILSEVKVKDTLRDLGYTIRDPDKAKRYEQQQAELADGKRRLLLAGGASIVVAALMGWMIVVMGRNPASPVMDLVTLGLALGTMFGPALITEKGVPEPPPRNLQPARPPRAGAFANLLGGFARPVRLPELSDRPLLRRLRVHHHLPHPLGIHQPHRPDAASQAVRVFSISSRTRPVASPTTEMLRRSCRRHRSRRPGTRQAR